MGLSGGGFRLLQGKNKRKRERVYSVITTSHDGPTGRLWKTPESKASKGSWNYSWTVGPAARHHTKNPCLINPPRQRRRGGREGASMWANKSVFTSKNAHTSRRWTRLHGYCTAVPPRCQRWPPNPPGGQGHVCFPTRLNPDSSSCYDTFLTEIAFTEIRLELWQQDAQMHKDHQTEMLIMDIPPIMP